MSTRRLRKAVPLRTPLLAGGVALAGVAAVALTLSGPKAPPEAGSSVQIAPAAVRSPGVSPSTTPATTQPAVAPSSDVSSASDVASGGTVAVVLGDGLSATPSAQSAFACAAVATKGWDCRNFAGAGSGYLSSGSVGSYADQLGKATALDDVGLVVVSGGGVDRAADVGQVRHAAQALVAEVVFAFPGAVVLLLPPFDAGGGTTPATTAVRDALRGSADGGDVRFVDASVWFRDNAGIIAGDGRSFTRGAAVTAKKRLAAAVPGLQP